MNLTNLRVRLFSVWTFFPSRDRDSGGSLGSMMTFGFYKEKALVFFGVAQEL